MTLFHPKRTRIYISRITLLASTTHAKKKHHTEKTTVNSPLHKKHSSSHLPVGSVPYLLLKINCTVLIFVRECLSQPRGSYQFEITWDKTSPQIVTNNHLLYSRLNMPSLQLGTLDVLIYYKTLNY